MRNYKLVNFLRSYGHQKRIDMDVCEVLIEFIDKATAEINRLGSLTERLEGRCETLEQQCAELESQIEDIDEL